MEIVQGIISFNGFQVDRMQYERNINNEHSNNYSEITPKFFIKLVEKKEDNSFFNIIFGVRIDGDKENPLPFKAEVIIRGFYAFKEDEAGEYGIEDLQKFKLINGSAILFPYLRSVLTDLTSKSKHQPVILPTVNFSKYITSKKLADLLLDSDFYEEN